MDDHLNKKINFDVPRDPTRNKSFLIWEDKYFEVNNLLEKLTFGRTKLIWKRSIQAAQEIKN